MSLPSHETIVQRQEIELPADAADSFKNFQILVRPMFELVRLREDVPFFARAAITFLPDVLLSRSVNSGSRFDRTQRTIARSGIDDILVVVYLSGSFTYEVDGRVCDVQAHQIAFFDLARPFCIQSDHTDNISLAVSRRRLAELTGLPPPSAAERAPAGGRAALTGVPPPSAAERAPAGGRAAPMPSMPDFHGFVLRQGAMQQLLLAHLRTCAEVAPRMGTAESQAISDATLHLVAGGLQSARRQAAGSTAHGGLASLTDMTDFIEERLDRAELGPDDLVEAFSLSRATLYRLFEPLGGVAAFILDRRLSRALQAITAPHAAHLRLKQLAHDLGFAHPTTFTRAFKKRFGMPPHAVRALRTYPDEVQSTAWRQAQARQLPLMVTATSGDG